MFAIPDHTVLAPVSYHPLSPATLVRSISSDPTRWRALLAGAALALTPVVLPMPSDDPRVTTWLSVWPSNQLGPVRRYEAPQGAFAVLSGQVVERSGDRAGARARVLRPGQARIFGPGYRHTVLNPGPEPAVTLHIQIAPLSAAAQAG
jgi:mannose-6-phosphate isomerase-like protein (cupin superfamily)